MGFFREHRKGIYRTFILVLILFLICFGIFSCSAYLQPETGAYVNISEATLVQLEEPEDDAPAMCVHTTMGDIVAELFPDQSPNYVTQFVELAEEGYYDNTYIFQVEPDIYFEAGTPHESGTLDTEDYEHVELEINADVWPFRGAFCAPVVTQEGGFWKRLTSNMDAYCGTRFVVCNSITFDADTIEEMNEVDEAAEPVNQAFLTLGGIPNYSQQMTVFAQAVGENSFATIDAITAAPVEAATADDGYTPPVDSIQILSIDIGTYADFVSIAGEY